MKRLNFIKKIPLVKTLLGLGVLFGVVAFGSGFYVALKPIFKVGLVQAINDAALSVQNKLIDLNRAVDENVALRVENAQLHRQIETKMFDRQVAESKKATEEKTVELVKKGGSPVARLVEDIQFEVPKNVSLSNLFTLSASYIRAEEYEKAAKILHYLIYEQGNASYQTAQNMLLLGVVFYRLDHFEGADQQFSLVLKTESVEANLKYQAQARLWKALVAERTHRVAKAQYWMHDLVDHHPKSVEASWVNSDQRPVREPASESHAAEHTAQSEVHGGAQGGGEHGSNHH